LSWCSKVRNDDERGDAQAANTHYLRGMKGFLFCFISIIVAIACNTSSDSAVDTPSEKVLRKPLYANGFDWITLDGTECLRLLDLQADSLTVLCTVCKEERENCLLLPSQPAFATLSTTHLSYFNRIASLGAVRGTAYAAYVMNPDVKREIENGNIASLSGERDLDFERTLASGANVVLTYPYGDQSFEDLKSAGLLVLPISEYLEEHPLGRAEWIRALGFLCGAESAADSAFSEIDRAYNALKLQAHLSSSIPSVFTGSNDNGVWYAPPGNSFISQFIRDASGSYIFSGHHTKGNISMDFEILLEKAMEVDYWGKVVYDEGALTLEKLATDDERYVALKAFKNHHVFYCNSAEKDYFGDGLIEPHVILADLIAILHPNILPDHKPVYFELIKE
jgi:iron complex transport system substrate-binding protein